jgi:hypothetical protein
MTRPEYTTGGVVRATALMAAFWSSAIILYAVTMTQVFPAPLPPSKQEDGKAIRSGEYEMTLGGSTEKVTLKNTHYGVGGLALRGRKGNWSFDRWPNGRVTLTLSWRNEGYDFHNVFDVAYDAKEKTWEGIGEHGKTYLKLRRLP